MRQNPQQSTLENITYTSSKLVAILRLATRCAYKSAECADQQLSTRKLCYRKDDRAMRAI